MRIVFCADASKSIGAGHVMRTLAIAESAIKNGIECVFVGRVQEIFWLHSSVGKVGFSQILDNFDFFENKVGDILVIDSYHIHPKADFLHRIAWHKIVVIADEFTPEYEADLVIHPGLDSSWYKKSLTNFRFGPKYIPLRNSIRPLRVKPSEKVRSLIVFGGGSDEHELATALARELRFISDFDRAIFFTSSAHSIERLDSRFEILGFGDNLDSEIDKSDLVLTTPSTSSFEVMRRGLPVGVACSAQNQYSNYIDFDARNIACKIGERIQSGVWDIDVNRLSRLIIDKEYRSQISENAKRLFRYRGSDFIIREIFNLSKIA